MSVKKNISNKIFFNNIIISNSFIYIYFLMIVQFLKYLTQYKFLFLHFPFIDRSFLHYW